MKAKTCKSYSLITKSICRMYIVTSATNLPKGLRIKILKKKYAYYTILIAFRNIVNCTKMAVAMDTYPDQSGNHSGISGFSSFPKNLLYLVLFNGSIWKYWGSPVLSVGLSMFFKQCI